MAYKKNISGLTPGTWRFRFRAKANDGRVGEWSGAFNYTVTGDQTPPPVPSKPNVTSIMGGVFVKWVESLYSTPIDFNRVDVYVSTGGAYAKFGSIATINGGINYVAAEGVTGPFTFKFAAIDRSGNVSAFSEASDPVSAGNLGIDTEPPSVPSNLVVTAATDTTDTSGAFGYANVSFTPSSSTDLLGHYIRYGTSSGSLDNYDFLEKGQNSKRINRLASGQTYYFQVNATDGSNPSAYVPASPVSVTIPGDTSAPAAPTGLVAVAGFNNVIAYWNRNSEKDVDLGRGTYNFQISTSNTFTPILQDRTITGTVASFTGLTTGTTYYVRVRAIDSSGNAGSWSATATSAPGKISGQASIENGTIVGDLVAASTLVGDKLIANTVDADKLKTNTGIVGKLFVGDDAGANKITIDGTATTPAIYYGTGTYANTNTPFYFDALGKFSLKDQLTWNGSTLSVKGSLNVTQASTFTGNVTLNSGGDLILNGGAIRATGSSGRVEIGSLGVYGYNATSGGTALVRIDANTGQLLAEGGKIGGWTINQSSLTTTNGSGQTVGLYSNGQLYMGPNFSVGADGSVTVSGTINVVGTGSNVPLASDVNTALSGKVGSGDVKNHLGGTNVTTISGGIINTGTINLNNVNVNSGTGASSIRIDSTGLKIYNSSNQPTVSLNSDGSASFTGTVTGSTINGSSINVTGQSFSSGSNDAEGASGLDFGLSNSFTSQYVRNGITNLGINGISLISANTAGVISSWYPYYDASVDLGIKSSSTGAYSTYRWRNLRLTGAAYFGGDGSTNSVGSTVSGGALIRINSTGTIYANTLGTGSGNTIVQDGGFLRVQTSSLRYKENVNPIDSSGYLELINLLKPVTYNYIGDTEWYGSPRILSGLIAEDLHEIPQFRTVVNYNHENQPDGIAYDRLVASVILAIQDLSDKVSSISSRLDELQA
jgi:Chaperone of endosialidase